MDRYQAFLGQHQVRHAKQSEQLSRVIHQAAIAGLAVLEQILHHMKRVLDLGTYACFSVLNLLQ